MVCDCEINSRIIRRVSTFLSKTPQHFLFPSIATYLEMGRDLFTPTSRTVLLKTKVRATSNDCGGHLFTFLEKLPVLILLTIIVLLT